MDELKRIKPCSGVKLNRNILYYKKFCLQSKKQIWSKLEKEELPVYWNL
jgi:hypothetical protein